MAVGQAGRYHSKAYRKEIESAKIEALILSTDYLKGYLEGYESRNGMLNRFLVKFFIRLKPPKVVAYEHELSKRQELSDRV